ncbi:hypothetical protein FOA52_005438 [Chlamydomonas sp. UWO 241]|nr:hypothetical protein FOA52_005438 [Chlamydomonas sp. UWO 241]
MCAVAVLPNLQAAREDLARSFSQAAAAEDLSRLLLEERRANEDLVVLSHWVVVDGEGGAGGGGGGGGHHRVSRGGARRARSADARVSEGDERARAWTAVAAAGKEEEEEQQGGGCSYDRASPSAGRSGGRRGGHLSEGGAPTAADSLGPQHATASLGGAGSGDVDAQPLDAIDGSGLCVALSCGGAG